MNDFKQFAFNAKNCLFRHHAVKKYHQIAATQHLDPEALMLLNIQKRKDIIAFAFDQTKFYRRSFESQGITRADFDNPHLFEQLPIVTRGDLKEHFDEFIADIATAKQWSKATTGGSTGTPITVLHDRRVPIETAWWRVARWWGVEPSDDIAFIYRLRRTFLNSLLNAFLWWPTRRIFLDASLMTKSTISDFIKRYNILRPSILQGYVGAVHEFALFVKENNIAIHSPQAVWVTAAPLTESQRILMQEVFSAPVYDEYGSCEVGWIACECKKRNGLHIMSDLRHIDIVDDKGHPAPDGEWGRILITDLENRVFPLIRYEIGDRGRLLTRTCSCGITLPLIDKICGRISDAVKLPSGSFISGEFLTTIFDDHPEAVSGFQIRQAADYSISLLCVPGTHPEAKKNIEQAHLRLCERAKNAVQVRLELIDYIPHDRGKTHFIISDVK